MLLGEAKREAPVRTKPHPKLRPAAPGELIQANRCASALSWPFGLLGMNGRTRSRYHVADGLHAEHSYVYLAGQKWSHCERCIILSDWRLRQLGIVDEPSDSSLSGNRPLDRNSKQATSGRSRNRIYSVGLVVPKSSERIEYAFVQATSSEIPRPLQVGRVENPFDDAPLVLHPRLARS
jgi:hypothetical protein